MEVWADVHATTPTTTGEHPNDRDRHAQPIRGDGMKSRGWTCRIGRRSIPRRSTAGRVYGLVEWDGDPTVIVGRTVDDVRRAAVRLLLGDGDGAPALADDDPNFVDDYPIPDPDGSSTDIASWLDALVQGTDTAWFSIVDDVVHAD
jgi:hypothetical protein